MNDSVLVLKIFFFNLTVVLKQKVFFNYLQIQIVLKKDKSLVTIDLKIGMSIHIHTHIESSGLQARFHVHIPPSPPQKKTFTEDSKLMMTNLDLFLLSQMKSYFSTQIRKR